MRVRVTENATRGVPDLYEIRSRESLDDPQRLRLRSLRSIARRC